MKENARSRGVHAAIAFVCCLGALNCTARPLDIGGAPNPSASCEHPLSADDGCGPVELCGSDGSGNGLDDNCDGQVDEGCVCTPGNVESCFVGPPGKLEVGPCRSGTQTCHGAGAWGSCLSYIGPTPEVCDGVDNDCNGCIDDGLTCTHSRLQCPSSVPDVLPLTSVTYPGSSYLSGSVSDWSWTITGGPCDAVFLTTTGTPPVQSFSVNGATTATPSATYSLSGDYSIVMTAKSGGHEQVCKFVQHVAGPGLRFELCWDTTGTSDLDLHVHEPNTTTSFFGPNSNFDDAWTQDCNFGNCDVTSAALPDWGYAGTPIANCDGGAPDSPWGLRGACNNPRLDIDNIYFIGVPENGNIDNPKDGDSFRALVHYYGTSNAPEVLVSHPLVNIYCGGHIKATYGQAPDLVPGFQTSGGWAKGNMWRVADVVAVVDAMGTTTDCQVTALHPGSATTGYRVSNNNISFEGQ